MSSEKRALKKAERSRGFYLGWVEFKGIGGFYESFLSELLEQGIKLSHVRVRDGVLIGRVSPLNYGDCAAAARRSGMRLKSGKRRGLYFLLQRYSRRAGLYAGLAVFGLFLSVAQSTVADIRIEGDVPTAQVIEILLECGIQRGVSTKGLRLSMAEQKLLLEIPNVAWVDVSVVGSRVTATVQSGAPMPDMLAADQPCNIISTRDAAVVDTVVRKGKLITRIGSGVQKGGLLVSGAVADGGEHILYQHASAEIIGEFTETREFFVPYNETIKLPNGEQTEFRYLVFMEDVYPLFFGEAHAEDALYSEHTEIIPFLPEEVPLKIKVGTYTKYTECDITRTDDDCIAELKKQKSAFEENFYHDFEIVSAVERLTPEQDGLRLAVDYILRGDIAQEQPIDLSLELL